MRSDYITLAQAARRCSFPTSPNALWRWARCGLKTRTGKRIRLRHVRPGHRIYTTEEWLATFMEERAEADLGHFDQQDTPPPNRRPRRVRLNEPTDREERIARAERTLERDGI